MPRFTFSGLFSCPLQVFAVVTSAALLAGGLPTAVAEPIQEADEDPITEPLKDDEADNPFAVPEGSPQELLEFIDEVKTARPADRSRAAVFAFVRLQVAAVVEAADKILAAEPEEAVELRALQEKFSALGTLAQIDNEARQKLQQLAEELADDERPAIQKLAGAQILQSRAVNLTRMSEGELEAFLSDLFSFLDRHGIDRTTYTLASGIARSLTNSQPETSAKVYEKLSDVMSGSEEPEIQKMAEKMMGAARRLRLPGNFMQLEGKTAEGETFDWSEYRGKVVLVDFWASWCGPCRAEIPNMKDNLEKYGEKGFAIVGINLDNTAEARQQYIENEQITWTNLVAGDEQQAGWEHPLATYYGVTGIPTAILVDKEGKVISLTARGSNLDRLLAEQLGPVEDEPQPATDGEAGTESRIDAESVKEVPVERP